MVEEAGRERQRATMDPEPSTGPAPVPGRVRSGGILPPSSLPLPSSLLPNALLRPAPSGPCSTCPPCPPSFDVHLSRPSRS